MTKSVFQGSRELLELTVRSFNEDGISDYAIIGGWCPSLRNNSSIKHPGTLDVDILFKDGHSQGALKMAITSLRNHGFMPSAKHPFQLLLRKSVAGVDLIYNVDLLHPQMNEHSKGMFVDHLELDVPLDEEELKLKKMCSIVQPNSRIIFDEGLYSNYCIDDISFPLVDFTGMFVTKIDSCQKLKRERDSLDILIAFDSEGINFKKLADLMKKNRRLKMSLKGFQQFLKDKSTEFDANVALFTTYASSPSKRILSDLVSIL